MRPDELTRQMVQAALNKIPQLDPHIIDDLLLGCAQPAGESGFNMARVVAVMLGLDGVPGVTVNRYCSSSLQTTRMALHAIRAGEGDVFISAGVETVSRYQFGNADGIAGTENQAFIESRKLLDLAFSKDGSWSDPRDHGKMPDIYISMGRTAENVAQYKNISRREQDEFGVRSQNLAEAATSNGFWATDITPVVLADGRVIAQDDGPRKGVTLEVVGELKPVFKENGTVTAGNCCSLNDGAAATIIMSDTKARDLGIVPLARVVSTGLSGLSPEIMGLGPVDASRRALKNAGLTMSDIDLIEINEAFAAQVIPSARDLEIDIHKLNVNGGAIAIGHPFGMTGARITSTLINSLKFHDKQFGLETMCVGGGQGMAMILERLS